MYKQAVHRVRFLWWSYIHLCRLEHGDHSLKTMSPAFQHGTTLMYSTGIISSSIFMRSLESNSDPVSSFTRFCRSSFSHQASGNAGALTELISKGTSTDWTLKSQNMLNVPVSSAAQEQTRDGVDIPKPYRR
ncbi:hypothetical protein R1flu_014299 [Riccia fluitans]|uniref:Uncharacterized protein n=1 Tax=Riccia fluitans TaxID=41844 RepID=A0ABD1YFQ3_9MARC